MLTPEDREEFERLRKIAKNGQLSAEDEKVFKELLERVRKSNDE
jgi:hypothetical protein